MNCGKKMAGKNIRDLIFTAEQEAVMQVHRRAIDTLQQLLSKHPK